MRGATNNTDMILFVCQNETSKKMSPFTSIAVLVALAAWNWAMIDAAPSRVHISQITHLVLRHGERTASRHAPSVWQIDCRAGCVSWQPATVECTPAGHDGRDVTWTCTVPNAPTHLHLVKANVGCEGWDFPDDEYIVAGSCGVEIELENRVAPRQTTTTTTTQHTSTPLGSTGHPARPTASAGEAADLASILFGVGIVMFGLFVVALLVLASCAMAGCCERSSTPPSYVTATVAPPAAAAAAGPVFVASAPSAPVYVASPPSAVHHVHHHDSPPSGLRARHGVSFAPTPPTVTTTTSTSVTTREGETHATSVGATTKRR